ncbi:histidine phosphatase family protein [Halosegnis sp.]|uniref:histidine phosphatase family protein n=1 Tax=Halosegnis sp. TaxID=2864959 RepID=UPI0035D50246
MTTLVALRHGRTAWNHEGRMQGWAPVPLDERGREQADAAGAWLADEYRFDAVYTSDLFRTRETTERVLAHLPNETATERAAFRERDVGMYQGLTYEEMFERFPEFGLGEAGAAAAERTPESGESLTAVSERVVDGFEQLCATHPDGTLLLVTHGGPIYMLVGHARGLSVTDAVLAGSQDNCGATVIDDDGGTTVRAENRTGWR